MSGSHGNMSLIFTEDEEEKRDIMVVEIDLL